MIKHHEHMKGVLSILFAGMPFASESDVFVHIFEALLELVALMVFGLQKLTSPFYVGSRLLICIYVR